MSDEPRGESPSAPQDEPREELPVAPDATPLPDANRRRLQALLHELLRDESVRRLLCNEAELASQPKTERS